MKASHNLARVAVSFDDDTLLPNGGLSVAALLAQRLGVADLVDAHVTVAGEPGANSGRQGATVIGTALAGRWMPMQPSPDDGRRPTSEQLDARMPAQPTDAIYPRRMRPA